MAAAPAFASASEALDVAYAALGYLAAADATALTAEEQAGCLRVLEKVGSVTVAADTDRRPTASWAWCDRANPAADSSRQAQG